MVFKLAWKSNSERVKCIKEEGNFFFFCLGLFSLHISLHYKSEVVNISTDQ